jgi:hypothetical protein
MSTTTGDTVKWNGTDVQTYGDIASMEGILAAGPVRGDLITMDWVAGAVWQAGPADVYSMDLPLVMQSDDEGTAIQQLRAVQAWRGTQGVLTRVVMVGSAQVTEVCDAVCVNAVEVQWDLEARNLVGCVLVFQNLSGGWVAA